MNDAEFIAACDNLMSDAIRLQYEAADRNAAEIQSACVAIVFALTRHIRNNGPTNDKPFVDGANREGAG